jgi:hypothetical protein
MPLRVELESRYTKCEVDSRAMPCDPREDERGEMNPSPAGIVCRRQRPRC